MSAIAAPYQPTFGWNTGNAEERSDQEMQALGWSRYRNPAELPSGATTQRVTRKQDVTYTAGDNEQIGQVDLSFDYYKAAEAKQEQAAAPSAPAAAAAAPAEVKGGTTGTSAADKSFNINDYEAPKASADEGYLDKYLANTKTDYNQFLEQNKKSSGSSPASNPKDDWKKYATDWGYSDIARRWDSEDRSSLTTDPQGNTVPRRSSNTMAGGVDYVASLSGFGKYQRPYT